MILGGRSLYDLSLDDFRDLIDNRVPEGPHLEYKETAYSGHPSDIREMLRDITALANADGGYLVMGIREGPANCAEDLNPIGNPETKAQAIHQACLDGIQERIQGLEVKAFELGFNQGIIVVFVPQSNQQPHMVHRDHHSDFLRRYGTDKRSMTIGETREAVFTHPLYRRLAWPEGKLSAEIDSELSKMETSGAPYVKIYTKRPVERFVQRYLIGSVDPHVLVIVSPFIGDLSDEPISLQNMLKKINADRTRTYVVTQEPKEDYHRKGVLLLEGSPFVEIRYNPDIHAKLYICWCREEEASFALFGSGNLTSAGLRHNLELGMMILSRGYGRKLVRELYDWSSSALRTQSQRVKAIKI